MFVEIYDGWNHLSRVYSIAKKIYKLTQEIKNYNMKKKEDFGFKAFIDSTEQEIPRPKNKRRRKSYYSGRKKKHTVKTQLMVKIKD